jgi:nucleotide-binding universal stress UspA family protein
MTGCTASERKRPVVCGVRAGDRAPAVATVAGMLARRLGRPLELLHVSGQGSPPDVGLMSSVQASLGDVIDPFDVVVRFESGDPQKRLADAGDGAELLVVGSAEGMIRRALGRDVTSGVIREPAVPVVVVPAEGAAVRFGHGVVCGVRDRRDLPCVRAAARLAGGMGESLALVNVLKVPIPTSLAIEGAPPPVPPEVHTTAEAFLEECAATVRDEVRETPVVITEAGQPGPELARVARERSARVVAVGTSHRGALAATLTGAASRHLVANAPVPVMVCPHDDEPPGP